MTDIWKRDEPESPCINICVIHSKAEICTGCLRTLNEIADWSGMDAAGRQAILDALPPRIELLKQRRGGRAARLKERG
ncbi:DUF1289 domain-containing protein [Falsihalocynthiibacter arcticus]|uniref:Fe-S oxidoreductase n=1 Tax=Falsihalocynthiibacter arcticus TaxID=1579316 RepID=A0A126V1V0_9RHOB|nr:DUF1289 domain-containing protein [Falsihalocynthiibacter arcticus]AML52301.1 hypothetical protein RC74_14380 [Falsihalocynthiibacter arcticus]